MILFSSLREYNIIIPDIYSVSDIDSIDAECQIEKVIVVVKDDSVICIMVLKPFITGCFALAGGKCDHDKKD